MQLTWKASASFSVVTRLFSPRASGGRMYNCTVILMVLPLQGGKPEGCSADLGHWRIVKTYPRVGLCSGHVEILSSYKSFRVSFPTVRAGWKYLGHLYSLSWECVPVCRTTLKSSPELFLGRLFSWRQADAVFSVCVCFGGAGNSFLVCSLTLWHYSSILKALPRGCAVAQPKEDESCWPSVEYIESFVTISWAWTSGVFPSSPHHMRGKENEA